jgi:L-cysteine:1D-myo-inositol 2-amino-2-deoxy-alpha-D-glucopyranoside ligase
MRSWPTVAIPAVDPKYALPKLTLKDTLSGTKKALPKKSLYRMYVCGITPYDATHLGHAATYLTFDLINRYLRATGAEVRYVQNITDIDDPLLERANRDGVDWEDLAHSQIELFRSDMVNLHVLPPESYIGAVEAIPLVTEAIEVLKKANTIYPVDDDLYFQVRSDTEFGTRSHYSQAEMQEIFSQRGGDPDRAGKKDVLDCLVWLAARPGEPSWPSPFGAGRPGWHIECSAIALAYLNPDPADDFAIDIQGGGSDLIFPHHEMGASQVAIMTGKPYAQTYVHTGMVGLDGEKMSKSKGNLVFVSKLIAAGVDPMVIRLALLNSAYGRDRMWTDSVLDEATARMARLQSALSRNEVAPTKECIALIIASLADNLDTVRAVKAIDTWIEATESGLTGGSSGELSRAIDTFLGIAI